MKRFLVTIVLSVLLAACTSGNPATPTAAPQPSTANQNPSQTGYPGTNQATDSTGYPVASMPTAYPIPTLVAGPPFTLDMPVNADAKQVSGTGPAEVPIKLVDVTNSGETLAQLVIPPDGKFQFSLTKPLVKSNRIAVMLGNVEGTKFKREDFVKGPGYEDYPLTGILFASTVVQ